MATADLELKLLVNNATNKVLFAEAGKDFVDFLFTLLAMPIGTAIQLLTAPSMVGSLGNIYSSLEDMSASYLKPSTDKSLLLRPNFASGVVSGLLQLDARPEPEPEKEAHFYMCIRQCCECTEVRCNRNCVYFTDIHNTQCPGCRDNMTEQLKLVTERTAKVSRAVPAVTGFAQDVVTYMVMDDLSVSPMSTISSVTFLNRFNIQNLGMLEERTVKFGMEQGLLLLKAALESKTVLTDVFVKAKAAAF